MIHNPDSSHTLPIPLRAYSSKQLGLPLGDRDSCGTIRLHKSIANEPRLCMEDGDAFNRGLRSGMSIDLFGYM